MNANRGETAASQPSTSVISPGTQLTVNPGQEEGPGSRIVDHNQKVEYLVYNPPNVYRSMQPKTFLVEDGMEVPSRESKRDQQKQKQLSNNPSTPSFNLISNEPKFQQMLHQSSGIQELCQKQGISQAELCSYIQDNNDFMQLLINYYLNKKTEEQPAPQVTNLKSHASNGSGSEMQARQEEGQLREVNQKPSSGNEENADQERAVAQGSALSEREDQKTNQRPDQAWHPKLDPSPESVHDSIQSIKQSKKLNIDSPEKLFQSSFSQDRQNDSFQAGTNKQKLVNVEFNHQKVRPQVNYVAVSQLDQSQQATSAQAIRSMPKDEEPRPQYSDLNELMGVKQQLAPLHPGQGNAPQMSQGNKLTHPSSSDELMASAM